MAPSVVLQDLAQDEAIRKNFEFLTNSKVFPKYDHLHQYKKENFSSVSDAVGLALLDKIQSINVDQCDPGDEDSFFIADIAEVIKSFQIWQDSLPMVQPFYAVKCNTNLMVIKTLAEMGCNFDCASKAEIDIVRSLGVETDRIIYANPCKTNSYIRYAREVDVQLTTVDNVQELYKIKKNHPDMGVLIRIATDDESAQCRLSTKFGCTMSSALNEILPTIAELGLNLKGVAFHVGSGATDFTSIYKAIKDSRVIFDKVLDMGLNPLELLDIGGGLKESHLRNHL